MEISTGIILFRDPKMMIFSCENQDGGESPPKEV
jgi:hypothetical protein